MRLIDSVQVCIRYGIGGQVFEVIYFFKGFCWDSGGGRFGRASELFQWEQSRLRRILVVRFFLLGNRGQSPSIEIGRGGGVRIEVFFYRYWGTEPLVW